MPTSLLLAAGLGLGVAGFMQQKGAAKDMASAQQQQIAQQQAIEAQRQKQAELEYRRSQLQLLRNSQKARAMSLTTATNQGAQFGSVLPGAYGQNSGQTNTQGLALDQNFGIGQSIFGLTGQLSQSKMAYASAQSDYQGGAGLSSLGGALITNAGKLGGLGKDAYALGGRALSFGTGPGSWQSS